MEIHTKEFMDEFYTFLREIYNVIPSTYKSYVYTLTVTSRVKDPVSTMIFFFKQCKPYQDKILNRDDTFITSLKEEFSFLNSYDSLDDNSKSCTLEYIRNLYIISYKEFKRIKSSRKNKSHK